jgi:hypothetical protein
LVAPPLGRDVLPLDGRLVAPEDRLPEDERELTPEERLRPAVDLELGLDDRLLPTDDRELPPLERVPPTERVLGAEYLLDPVPTELGERVVGPR